MHYWVFISVIIILSPLSWFLNKYYFPKLCHFSSMERKKSSYYFGKNWINKKTHHALSHSWFTWRKPQISCIIQCIDDGDRIYALLSLPWLKCWSSDHQNTDASSLWRPQDSDISLTFYISTGRAVDIVLYQHYSWEEDVCSTASSAEPTENRRQK